MYQHLAKSPVFKGIAPEKIESLFNTISYRIKNIESGDLIAQRDEEVRYLSIVLQGSVRGEMLDFSGKILKIEDIYAPRPISAAFLFGQSNRYPVNVVANEESVLLIIPKESVLKMFQLSQVFLNNYLNIVSNRAQFLSQRIWFLSFKTIKGKLAQYILGLAKPDKIHVTLPLTQKDLAEFFGVTRPSLARALGDLQRKQIIAVNRKEITIMNRTMLIRLIE